VGWAEASRGHYEAAVARCRRSLEQAPDRVSRAYASLFLGFALLEKGDHEPARALLEPMASELDAFGLPQWHALAATLTGESLRLDKRIDEGAAFVERGIQVATRAGYTYAIAFAQRAAARLARDRGCADEASGKCQQALDTFDDSGAVFEAARTRLDLAEIAFEQKDTSRASRELTRAARAFEGLGEKTYRDRTVMLAAKLGLERALLPSRRKH
jgi:tetratricopeptide (TPR) repeat protein